MAGASIFQLILEFFIDFLGEVCYPIGIGAVCLTLGNVHFGSIPIFGFDEILDGLDIISGKTWDFAVHFL